MASGLAFQFPISSTPQRFKISVNQDFLDLTRRKVADYRPTVSLSDEWQNEGPPTKVMTVIAEHWRTKYDWRSVEQTINSQFEHYATTVQGSDDYPHPIPLHFIHQQSKSTDAIPLLLLHGWPSSSLEWSKVIKPLVEHAGQSYHIVAPDLPGYGFSPAPTRPGLGPRQMGKAFDALMHQLGYARYGLVTTDLGWFTGMWMVHDVANSITAHFTDFFLAPPSPEDQARQQSGETTAEESAHMAAVGAWFKDHWGYATIHAQKPLAMSLALTDSPVGFLGWFMDLNHGTSDGYSYTFDELITDAMILWIPGPYANIRAYHEFFKPELQNFQRTEVPTGVSQWGWGPEPYSELAAFPFVPESWTKRVANTTFFRRHERGGHFPAVSQPEAWVQDVHDFFSSLKAELAASK